MGANAFIDALVCAQGAKAVYESRLRDYLEKGYDRDKAEERAKQDAEMTFNRSQQSNEGAYLAPMQVSRRYYDLMFSLFRNASFAYGRQFYNGMSDEARLLRDPRRALEQQTQLYLFDGLSEDDARAAAEKDLSRAHRSNLTRAFVYGFFLPAVWNAGGIWFSQLLGNDERKKRKAWEAVLKLSLFGPLEGFGPGKLIPTLGAELFDGEIRATALSAAPPMERSIDTMIRQCGSDRAKAAQTAVDLLCATLTGVDPAVVMNLIEGICSVAFYGDYKKAPLFALGLGRALNLPESETREVLFDQIKLDAETEDELGMTANDIARLYADSEMRRHRAFTQWLFDETKRERKWQQDYTYADNTLRAALSDKSDREAGEAFEDPDGELMKRFRQDAGEGRDVLSNAGFWKGRDKDLARERYSDARSDEHVRASRINAEVSPNLSKLYTMWLKAKTVEERRKWYQKIVKVKRNELKNAYGLTPKLSDGELFDAAAKEVEGSGDIVDSNEGDIVDYKEDK
jgi:hypothetical protein